MVGRTRVNKMKQSTVERDSHTHRHERGGFTQQINEGGNNQSVTPIDWYRWIAGVATMILPGEIDLTSTERRRTAPSMRRREWSPTSLSNGAHDKRTLKGWKTDGRQIPFRSMSSLLCRCRWCLIYWCMCCYRGRWITYVAVIQIV